MKNQKKTLPCSSNNKFFCVICFLFAVSFSLVARENDSAGKKQLFAVKTKYFEIIYPGECRKSAEILFEQADAVYSEVTSQYGLTPSFSLPIVLTPAVDSFNAFWTSAPYNHIVIYDTSFSVSSDLAVFSETLIQTFRHELTHAVTYNMKSPFWNATSTIFGDCITPASLWISPGMAEGATVTSESAQGEGRLNDEFAKHMVKQAKIENQFPSYYDATGARDKYPTGSFYYFNGAFHQWLQQEFGMQKYAEFWYRLVNLKSLTVGTAFKQVYRIKLKDAWKEFEKSYPVPEIQANPLKTGLVQDFFSSRNDKFSPENRTGSYLTSLTKSQNAIAWLENSSGRIFYVSKPDFQDNLNEKQNSHTKSDKNGITSKPKMLVQVKNAQQISLSDDGRFIAISYFSDNSQGTKARIKIFDINKNKFFTVKTKGLKESAIIKKQDKYFLVSTKYTSPTNSIYLEEIAFNSSDEIQSTQFFAQIDLPLNVNVSNFIQMEDGEFAFIMKNRLEFSIVTYSFAKEKFTKYQLPEENMKIRSLSYAQKHNALYFNWTSSGTMPRFGQFEPAEKKFLLSGCSEEKSGDISGGIFNPVYFDGEIVFIGQFYQFSRILKIPSTDYFFESTGTKECFCQNDTFLPLVQKNEKLFVQTETQTQTSQNTLENLTYSSEIPEKKFNPLKYYLQGVLLPFTVFFPENFGCNAGLDNSSGYLAGLTFITSDPWTDGSTSLYTSTFGWDYLNESFGIELVSQNSTWSNLLQMNCDTKTEFDKKGWKNSSAMLTLQVNIETGNNSLLMFANQARAGIGRQNNLISFVNDNLKRIYYSLYSSEKNYYFISDSFSATFSTVRKAGAGRYEKQGFTYTLGISFRYDSDLSLSPLEYVNAINLNQNFKWYIPHLIPYYSPFGKTVNFPAKTSLSLFPIDSEYKKRTNYRDFGRSFTDVDFEFIFFASEIQMAIPFFHAVYLNDFAISGGYKFSIATGEARAFSNLEDYNNLESTVRAILNGNFYWLDSVFIKSSLTITPNTGGLARLNTKTSLYLQTGCSLRQNLLQDNKNSSPFFFEIGFSSTF